ncbi:metallophosphoesterase [Pontibacter sp. SGAir0037]|uniref:metallophosphoesterase n=1 Tax=Pontibacter sp. SGAir0037 TaxID=2571030 RepID=UPI0010CD5924|nr:metallophosphoesterase [Pontibacter sp. SGAir0037]QCR21570.1 phosphohydrolase [Pontibacter sp. SGAir0037]
MTRFIMILGVLSLLMDWYVYQGIKRLTAGWKSVGLRKTVRTLYWVFFIGFILGFAYAIYLRFSEDKSGAFVQWFINAFLTFFVTKLVFMLVLLAEDIYRVIVAATRLATRSGKRAGATKSLFPQRRKVVSQLGLVLAGIPFFSFVYGITKGKYDYRVHRQTLYFDDLPEAFNGFTITQLSDVHSGSFDDAGEVQRGIELAMAQQSDLYVFTGDLVNDHATEIVPYKEMFRRIKAPFGQFSILGNHDYGMYAKWHSDEERENNMTDLQQHHADMDYRLLLDEHVKLEKDGQEIVLLGVENWGKGFIERGDLNKALQGVDANAFKILLSHDPSHWDMVVKNHPTHIHLTLSGHTHGMQFGVETPLFRWSPVQYRYKNWAGVAQENNKMLYVNRGFGFIGFSGRVGIWPEITVLELRKGRG